MFRIILTAYIDNIIIKETIMNKKLVDAINDQIKYEFFSSFLYLAMASYAAGLEMTGFQSWLLTQADEEQLHATKFVNYLNDRGERALIKGFEDPKNDYSSLLEAFEDGLAHEKIVTQRINNLMSLALEDKDFATSNFLNWYIDEQVEEESSFTTVINKLKMVGDSAIGLYQLDKEMATRPAAPTTITQGNQ